MVKNENNSYEESLQDENQQMERNTYRVRRPHASRRRSRKKASMPGGIRQRRNKHWNW